jgi:hypothetical protein
MEACGFAKLRQSEQMGKTAMSMSATKPVGAHLVGSVPLNDEREVFSTVSSILGSHVRRIPDGETGVRTNWIGWQLEVLQRNPALELVPPDPTDYVPAPHFRVRAGVAATDIRFDNLGYADAARASYAAFARLKAAGTILTACRFQVSLPTPLATIAAFVVPADQAAVLPAYETQLLAECDAICAAIPHDQLAIQWDVAVEFGILEGLWPAPLSKEDIIGQLVALSTSVPADVELGYHLCYGDAGHKHFKEPQDTSVLVAIANGIAAGVTRPLNWIHLPVPRDRSDDAYFAPLRDLKLHPETELYLGLVHYTDGVEGAQRRIAVAQSVVQRFGVATECGMGRRPAETIPDLLRIHAAVADAV